MVQNKISYYKNCRITKPETVNIEAALYWIQTGSSKNLIESVRSAETEQEKNLFKQKLPAVTFGGLFEGRTDLIKGSGFACLDFDKVSDVDYLKDALKASKYIFSYWDSPSNLGVKALVKIPKVNSKEEYKAYYKGLLKHFRELSPDKSTKDINRLCFESYDPNLYLSEGSEVFKSKIEPKPVKNQTVIVAKTNIPEGKVIDRIIAWWVKKFQFGRGNRNNSLFVLACALCNFGVNKGTTEELFYSFEEEDFHYNEIQNIINSAYKKADFNSQSFPK